MEVSITEEPFEQKFDLPRKHHPCCLGKREGLLCDPQLLLRQFVELGKLHHLSQYKFYLHSTCPSPCRRCNRRREIKHLPLGWCLSESQPDKNLSAPGWQQEQDAASQVTPPTSVAQTFLDSCSSIGRFGLALPCVSLVQKTSSAISGHRLKMPETL